MAGGRTDESDVCILSLRRIERPEVAGLGSRPTIGAMSSMTVPLARMSELRQLRLVAFSEGLSFVVLLFVAMPLKYIWGLKLAVRIVGSVHGALFLIFLVALVSRSGRAAMAAAPLFAGLPGVDPAFWYFRLRPVPEERDRERGDARRSSLTPGRVAPQKKLR